MFRRRRLLFSITAALSAFAMPAAADAAILHDQQNNAAPDGTESTVNSGRLAADDFTVPSGQSWIVETVRADTDGGAEPATFNIRFYTDAAQLPGAIVADRPNVVALSHAPEVVDLGSPVSLSPGTYWVSVQSPLDGWLWGNRSVVSGNMAAWSGTPPPAAGCMAGLTGWFPRARDCTTSGGPDQRFRLDGTVVFPPPAPPASGPTGRRAAALKKCAKVKNRKKKKRCKKRARSLPV